MLQFLPGPPANEILARGYRYGENRVVVGAHWQSDTEAARMVASVAYAKLHTSERFLEQMKKAREEFKRIKDSASSAIRQTRATQDESAVIYDISGKRVSPPEKASIFRAVKRRLCTKVIRRTVPVIFLILFVILLSK